METGPREIVTPFRPIPLKVPEGIKPNDFLKTAKKVRDRCIKDAAYANSIRWEPAFKRIEFKRKLHTQPCQ